MALVASLDAGTSSVRVIIFDENGGLVTSHQIETSSRHPHPGWAEQDAMDTVKNIEECLKSVVAKLEGLGRSSSDIKAVGITNHRESIVVWDRLTGMPLSPMILWLDTRNTVTCEKLVAKFGSKDHFRPICGLPITTYFSGTKLRWVLDNIPEAADALHNDRLMFGTADSWIIWNLTGATEGGVHVTDVTNASRTMLMNIKTCEWDEHTCEELGIPMKVLPDIKSSSQLYGQIHSGPLHSVPVAGALGDQQAATVGQLCFSPGEAKNTYGTGCFMLMNTGETPVPSHHGLLTTALCQLGPDAPVLYALEGSIAIAGAAIGWLRDNLGIIENASDVEELARTVEDTGGLYFVPAFSGLFAPRWRMDAKGTCVGMTQYTNKAHFARAILEAVCYQSREVLEAIQKDSNIELTKLFVDGGMSQNSLVLESQADILGIPVARPSMVETTALGAALVAGLAVGVWESEEVFVEKVKGTLKHNVWFPRISPEVKEARFAEWNNAVLASLPHEESKGSNADVTTKAALFGSGLALGFLLAAKFLRN